VSHGFRVYNVELFEGMRRKPVEDWHVAGQHYASYAHALASELAAAQDLLPARLSWGEIQALSEISNLNSMATDDRCLRWIGASLSGRRLSMEIKYGMVGTYSDAMGVDGDTSITNKAPSRSYRAELVLPEEFGTGLLAVETIGRSAPAGAIAMWFGAASCVKEKGNIWWRPKIQQVTDTAYLTELIANSRSAEVTLKHVGFDEIGDRRRTQYKLQASLNDAQRDTAIGWIKSRIGTESRADLQGMLKIVGVDNTGDLDFTDGHISVDDGEATTRIGLSDVREIFTYPIGKDRPSASDWESQVRTRFQQLEPTLDWS
jgi:hypothetical protein